MVGKTIGITDELVEAFKGYAEEKFGDGYYSWKEEISRLALAGITQEDIDPTTAIEFSLLSAIDDQSKWHQEMIKFSKKISRFETQSDKNEQNMLKETGVTKQRRAEIEEIFADGREAVVNYREGLELARSKFKEAKMRVKQLRAELEDLTSEPKKRPSLKKLNEKMNWDNVLKKLDAKYDRHEDGFVCLIGGKEGCDLVYEEDEIEEHLMVEHDIPPCDQVIVGKKWGVR